METSGRLLATLFIICALLTLAIGGVCPPASQINPCTCSENEFISVVQCLDITDMDILVGVFRRSGDRSFSNFALANSTLMYLPAISLSEKRFNQVILVNVTLASVFDQQPDTENELELITISKSRIYRRVGWELFKNLNKLKFFQCEETEISKIGSSFAENVDSGLTNFILTRTKTEKIHDTAFARMTELFDIQITDSKIKILKRSMFARPSAIEQFNFAGNEIKSLDDDLFTEMPHLKSVLLEGNKLSTLSEAVFGERFNIFVDLNLKDNPMICDCEMKWIVTRQNKYLEGYCALPDDFTGRSLASLNRKDFQYCPKK